MVKTKKTLLILIGIAVLMFCLVICSEHASAYSGITYNRGASASWYGVITWWGEVNNSAFYTADQAGELFLYQATKTANDSAVVDLNINLRPTDEYVMGGQKEDLWLNVSAMTYTSANISINGTSINGSYLNETIYVTGPGNYSFTNLFRTATGCYVRNLMGATGSLRMNITQGKWGVVWKLGNSTNMNSYFYFCGFACNGSATESAYWNETNGTMNFMPNYASVVMTLNNFVNFNWGQNNSNGNPVYGCNIDFGGYSASSFSFFSASTSAGGGRLSFYDCNFHGFRSGSGSSAFVLNNYNLTMVGCTMDRGFGITSANNTYMYRCNIGGSSQSIIGGFTNPVFIGDLLLTDATGRAIYLTTTNGFDASNITTKNCSVLIRCFDLQGNVNRYLRNSKVNTLYMTWAGTPVGTPKFYIVYGLFGRVMQINTTNGIPYANISVYESINGGAWTPTWVLNTGANGYIPYTWMNRSNYTLYDAYPGNTTLRFVVQREGFQTLNFTMMINQESNETWIMRPNSTITILESLANATGTNVTSFDGTNYTIWNNYTGNTTSIILHETILNATGTHAYYLSPAGYHVWANYTGNGSTASSYMDIYPDKIFNLEYTYYIAMDKFDDTHYIIAYRDGDFGGFDGGADSDGDGEPDYLDTDDDGDGVDDADDDDTPTNETSDTEGGARGGEGYGKVILCTILPDRNETQFSDPIIFCMNDVDYIDVSCFNSTDFVLSYNNETSDKIETIIGRTLDYSTATFGNIYNLTTYESQSTRCLALNETNFIVAFPIATDGYATVFNRIGSWDTHTLLNNITFTTDNNPLDIRLDNFNETHFVTTYYVSGGIRISISETVGYTRLKYGIVNASTDYYNMKIFNTSQIMIAYNAGGCPLFLNISSYDIATNTLTRITNGTVLNPEPTYPCAIAFFNTTCGYLFWDENTVGTGAYNGTSRAFVIKYDNFNWTTEERLSNPEDTSFICAINMTDHRFIGAFHDLGKSNYGCAFVGDMSMVSDCEPTSVETILNKLGPGIAIGMCMGLPIGINFVRKKRRHQQ